MVAFGKISSCQYTKFRVWGEGHDGKGKISADMSGGGGYRDCAVDLDRLLAVCWLRAFWQHGNDFPFAALGGGVHGRRLDFRDRAGLGVDEIRVCGHGLGG